MYAFSAIDGEFDTNSMAESIFFVNIPPSFVMSGRSAVLVIPDLGMYVSSSKTKSTPATDVGIVVYG